MKKRLKFLKNLIWCSSSKGRTSPCGGENAVSRSVDHPKMEKCQSGYWSSLLNCNRETGSGVRIPSFPQKYKEMKVIKETCYKGTRIILGNEKRDLINKMIRVLKEQGFTEISIPIIQSQETFTGKVGAENNNLMYNFKDRGDRDICLAPEYTAVIQKLSKTTFKNDRNVKVFYVQECFRGEKPAGRFRQFTQLGVEIINPDNDYNDYLQEIAYNLIQLSGREITLNTDVTRGLDYYKEGKGFEIACDELGSSKQVCGGGEYDGGIGFAIGISTLLKSVVS